MALGWTQWWRWQQPTGRWREEIGSWAKGEQEREREGGIGSVSEREWQE